MVPDAPVNRTALNLLGLLECSNRKIAFQEIVARSPLNRFSGKAFELQTERARLLLERPSPKTSGYAS
jgi:hypothetical protein